jgi:glycosyltransferase involved in cell wall biosynthesis
MAAATARHDDQQASTTKSGSMSARSERVRICFVGLNNLTVLAPDLDPRTAAGEPVQQTLLARACARLGYSVSTIASYAQGPDTLLRHDVTVFRAYEPDKGVPVIRFVHPRFTGLWRALRRANADVYYVSCAGAIVGQIALFCRRYGKRFVFRVASDADCAPDTLLIQYWRDRRLYEYGLRRADAILVQSEFQRRLLQRNYGLSSELAGMLVDIDGPPPTLAARDVDVLWVSNLRPLKRPDLLFDLAAALPDRSFCMAGGRVAIEGSFYDDCAARAAQYANLAFRGAVPYREVSGLYRRAKVFVNTSDVEGFPNTYLQAWASGTPVVAYFDPDGVIAREGLGAAAKSASEMREAVEALTRDEAAWRAASARCRAYVLQRFSDDVVLEPYLRVLAPRGAEAQP